MTPRHGEPRKARRSIVAKNRRERLPIINEQVPSMRRLIKLINIENQGERLSAEKEDFGKANNYRGSALRVNDQIKHTLVHSQKNNREVSGCTVTSRDSSSSSRDD